MLKQNHSVEAQGLDAAHVCPAVLAVADDMAGLDDVGMVLQSCPDRIRVPGADERDLAVSMGRSLRDLLMTGGAVAADAGALSLASGAAAYLGRMAEVHPDIVIAVVRDARRAVMPIPRGGDPVAPFRTVFYQVAKTLDRDPAVKAAYAAMASSDLRVPEGILDGDGQ